MTATLDRYMTRHPHSIRVDENVATAQAMMAKLNVRHLPVLDGGTLVGVVSDRDLKQATSAGTRALKIGDVCVEEPYAVDIDTSMFVVAAAMADKHIGSAIVLENGKVAGIFTSVDACRALADTLTPQSDSARRV
jgi:acetoin utilization protein AcuB